MVEENAGTLIYEIRVQATGHSADTHDGGHRGSREHVADRGIKVGAPSLMGSPCQTNDYSRPPSRVDSKRLREEGKDRHEGEDQHRSHSSGIGVHAQFVNKNLRQIAAGNGKQRHDEIQDENQGLTHRSVGGIAELVGKNKRGPRKGRTTRHRR